MDTHKIEMSVRICSASSLQSNFDVVRSDLRKERGRCESTVVVERLIDHIPREDLALIMRHNFKECVWVKRL